MDEFIEKLEADQKRLRDHLRGQVLRFQKIGEYLNRVQQADARLFVVGEGQLDGLARLIANEFLRSWPVVPVSMNDAFTEDFEGVNSADDPVRVPRSYPRKVRDLARHLNESDMILALIHDGQNSQLKKILKIAKKASVKVLAVGGVDAREDLRDYCQVFLPLPTRGIKTICEASFICARLIGRFARAAKLEQQVAENSDRDIEESQQKAKEAWNGLKKVGEQAAKQARKKLKDSSGITPKKTRTRENSSENRRKEGSGEARRKKKTGKHKRKKVEESTRKRRGATASSENDRDGSGERSRSSSKRQPVTSSSEKRHSGRQKTKKKGTRRSRDLKKEAKTSGRQRADRSSETSKSSLSSRSSETSRSSNERHSKVSSKIKSRKPHEDKIIVPDQLESSDVNEISISEIGNTQSISSKRRSTPGPGVSGELIPPKWLEDNESVQEPIGMGSSFKSSGVFGDLGLQSDDLMPRYIRDALDPNSIPMPSASFDPIRDVEETKTARFVSNRFKVQECTLRFASGGFPDDTVQEHPLIQLDSQNVSFSLDGEDDAAATLSQGDELWLRIEVPAFLEPILARAAIVGFETLDNQDGLRFNLRFTDIENEHRRKIHIAAESLATTQ
ncbi:MAG: hypothetical protein P1V97_03800 [Planctomycetota bacterium]|nr:hypothetical protein [Planctomycetota bacterium]